MSVVVALRHRDGGVLVGADTLMSNVTNHRQAELPVGESKMAVLGEGLWIVGFVGSLRVHDVVESDPVWNKKLAESSVDDHLRRVIVPGLRASLKQNGSMVTKDGVDSMPNGSEIIVASGNEVWMIQNGLSVLKIGSYDAIGSGWLAAKGSLHTTEKLLLSNDEWRVRLAIDAAIGSVVSVGGRIEILRTIVEGNKENTKENT